MLGTPVGRSPIDPTRTARPEMSSLVPLNRSVLHVRDERRGGGTPTPISRWMDRSAIVLLGDPGSGKTTVFRTAAGDAPDADCMTVRRFLHRPLAPLASRTLFLDALDEARTGDPSSQDKIDRISGLLESIGKPRFRLSCRAADWFGASDLSAITDAAADGEVTVLRLLPLCEAEIVAVAGTRTEDPRAFLAEARGRGLDGLLGNPETLGLLLDVVTRLGEWPGDRFDLYERACGVLASEASDAHRRSPSGAIPAAELAAEAGGACAALVCADVTGVALTPDAADEDFASSADLPTSHPDRLDAAARRRLFTTVEADRVVPQHRTVAEFLGGRFVARRLREGLPVERVRALLAAEDGGTVSELRGLLAWTVCHGGEAARSLVDVDPYGILRHGAVSRLGTPIRRDLLRALAGIEDPWFRSQDWDGAPVGELFTPELDADFAGHLRSPDAGPHLRATLLEALRGRALSADLAAAVESVARNPSMVDFERHLALEVLAGGSPSWTTTARDLVVEFSGRRVDDDAEAAGLWAEVLRLAPTLADADAVLSLLRAFVAVRRPGPGRRSLSLLADDLPLAALPTLLDRSPEAVTAEARGGGAGDALLFLEVLVARMAEEADVPPDPSRLWGWIVGVLGQSAQGRERTNEAIARLCRDDRYLSDLFAASVRRTQVDELAGHVRWFFWIRTGRDPWPDLGARLLALAEAEPEEARAWELFGLGLQQAWDGGDADLALFAAAAEMAARGRFEQEFEDRSRLLVGRLPRLREIGSEARARLDRGLRIRRARLAASRDDVRAGRDVASLEELAEVYLGFADGVDEAAPPMARLVAATDPETAAAAMAGFAAAVASLPPDPDGPEPSTPRGRRSPWPLAAWFLATPNDSHALSALPDGALAAVAGSLVENGPVGAYVEGGGAKVRDWLGGLAARRPDVLTGMIEASARPRLAAGERHVPVLDALAHEPWLAGVARDLAPRLLAAHPGAHPDSIDALMSAALAHVPGDELLALAEGVLQGDRVRGTERARWLAVRFLRLPDGSGLDAMHAHATGSEEHLWACLDLVEVRQGRPDRPGVALTRAQREALAVFVGRRVPHTNPPDGGWGGSHNPWDASWIVGRQIDRLAADPSDEAAASLDRLAADEGLSSYRDRIRHARAGQRRARREAAHRRPDLAGVVATLRGGPPANAADLFAFVLDHLGGIKRDLRNTATDRYKTFWNEGSNAEVTTPKVEDSGRDRLVDMLNERMERQGVVADPEGHMADDNRCDVSIAQGARTVPIEVKRQHHQRVWTALSDQLDRKYASDVRARGFGIYVVLWYGAAVQGPPLPPGGGPRPASADEMEAMLNASITPAARARLRAVVLDISPPAMG